MTQSNKFSIPGWYALVDQPVPTHTLPETLHTLCSHRVSLIQYRRKNKSSLHYQKDAQTILNICREYGVPLLINDDVELCQKLNADGVHLGQEDMPLKKARALLGPEKIIGVTCHAQLSLAQASQADGADYVAFGRFFASTTKPQASPAPMSLLTEAKKMLDIPLVAIGGITLKNAAEVISAGADLVALQGGLSANGQLESNCEAFRKMLTA